MLHYDYGPVRFSLVRGFLLTVLVPVCVALCLAAAYQMFFGEPTFAEALRRAADEIGGLYREYPQVAIIMHGLFFLKGLMYRRRYVNYAPMLLTLVAVGAFGWLAAVRLNLLPAGGADAISELTSASSAPQRSTPASSAREQASLRSLENKLALHTEKPNRLQQQRSRVVEVAQAVPNQNGELLFSGYLGAAPVVYVLNDASALSVADSALRSTVAGACAPHTSFMDGQPVAGCLGWVEEPFLGPVSLGRLRVFFTPDLPPGWPRNRVVLGANALKPLSLERSSSGLVTVRRKLDAVARNAP